MVKRILPLVTIFICSLACRQIKDINSPPGYDLGAPQVIKLPADLSEISGIAFNNGDPQTIYAQQDEDGSLFYFSPDKVDVKELKFGKKGDYEDLGIWQGNVIILRSEGLLFSFRVPAGSAMSEKAQQFADILPKAEYEAMYADEVSNRLYVLCKDCSTDNAAESITGYTLTLDTGATPKVEATFQVNVKEIAKKLNKKKFNFRPSALAKNKLSNEWYILSSVNKLLVIMDNQWKLKDIFDLDPAIFSQPEGIAFDMQHNLYISNERGVLKNATVLKFMYNKDKK